MSSDPDLRSPQRKILDEQIAAEPPLAIPDLPTGATPTPVEDHLRKLQRRPVALIGVVENGLVRLLDTNVNLPERSRVIVVATELSR